MTLRNVIRARHEAISFNKIIQQMRLLQSMKNRFRKDEKLKTSMVGTKHLKQMLRSSARQLFINKIEVKAGLSQPINAGIAFQINFHI